ncbi:hypothetical protein V6N12_027554 [Hibiscus sabdariffa]|uniref:BTB/POZ and TAZ domain-containing protein 3 n=1 Tax=Hibiscus sabdariffa TaxID=183260 RepID=A0ABR2F3B9_9ROSI
MALKFLNKKGWHTGSLRNIENVWKAEQKHEAEQKKLEELRKQIHEERERSEFRLLQEQAGLVPKQERLDFLYDSGLAVGKGTSSSAAGGSGAGFKALEEALPSSKPADSSANQPSSAPGALFEDKPHSANDAWRKLHSDPLLMIRQREQEALARIKNNPVQMAMIRKSVVEKKQKEKSPDHKERRKKHHRSSSKDDKRNRDHHHKRSDNEGRYRRTESDSEDELKEAESQEKSFRRQKYRYDDEDDVKRKHGKSKRDKYSSQPPRSIDAEKNQEKDRPASDHHKRSDKEGNYHRTGSDSKDELKEAESRENNHRRLKYEYDDRDDVRRNHDKSRHDKYFSQAPQSIEADKNQEKDRPSSDHRDTASRDNRRRGGTSKLSEGERASRLREMQEDAELHEEQRWKRLKKAEENDAWEATVSSTCTGRNFLDAAHKSIYEMLLDDDVVSDKYSSQWAAIKQRGLGSCCTIGSAWRSDPSSYPRLLIILIVKSSEEDQPKSRLFLFPIKCRCSEEVNPVDTLPVPEAPTCSLVSDNCNIPKPPPLPSKISTRSKYLRRPLECCVVPKETTHTWDKLFKDGYGADVCIVTEDRSFVPAHSIVLSIASPVLCSIIGQSKVKHGMRYIKIPGVPDDAIRVFLRFLYSSRYEEEELKKFVLHLLVLSHAYSVPQLKRVCISLLEKSWLNRENVIDVLQLARNCDAPRLTFVCIRMVVKDFKSVSSTEGWKVMKRVNPALEQELVESVVEADSRKQERQRKIEEKKVYLQLYEAMEALLHICKDGCRTIGPRDKVLKGNQVTCNFPACKGLEALVRHFSGCKTRVPGGCSHCKRMWQLLELHSRMCNEPDSCKVPLCRHFKEKIQQQCKKDETKWKLLVSKVIAAKNAVGPLSSRRSGLL